MEFYKEQQKLNTGLSQHKVPALLFGPTWNSYKSLRICCVKSIFRLKWKLYFERTASSYYQNLKEPIDIMA